MTDSDDILFKDEIPAPDPDRTGRVPWKILIVDDEEEVHRVTTFMLSGQCFEDRPFVFLHAMSGAEARELLAAHDDIAVILLDVVMETDDSGLQLVRFIRTELGNRAVRIILRTGQPGKAPAARVILEYDIDDYKEKTELTLDKMLVSIVSALRSYRHITTIDANRQGLKRIIEASADIFERQSLQKLGCGVLSQLAAILQLKEDALLSQASGLTASGMQGQAVILAATGAYCACVNRFMDDTVVGEPRRIIEEARLLPGGFLCAGRRCAWHFRSQTGSENFLYFETTRDLDENDHDLLHLFFTNVSLAFDNLFLNRGIEDTQKEVIFHIADTVECRSSETGSHVRRVAEFARFLALKCGLGEEEAEMLKLASTVHDLGKIGIPDAILNKPGRLTAEEYDIIKTHVLRGHAMLSQSESPIIRAAATIVLMHHERWDGQGYPQGLRGEEIHLHGRIVAVADVFDALSSRRIYHEAWSWDDVYAHFVAERARHFDPALVDLLLDNRRELTAIGDRYRDDPVCCTG